MGRDFIRFGVGELALVCLLLAVHLLPLPVIVKNADEYARANLIPLFIALLVLPGLCAAWLSYRYATVHQIHSATKRLVLLIAMDILVTSFIFPPLGIIIIGPMLLWVFPWVRGKDHA